MPRPHRDLRRPPIRAALFVPLALALASASLSAWAQPAKPPSAPKPSQQQPTAAPTIQPSTIQPPAIQPPTRTLSGREQALLLHDEAQLLYQEGLYPQAIAKLEAATGHDPDAIVLHYNLGLIYEKMGALEKALTSFRTCLDLEQNPAERKRLDRTIARISGAQLHRRQAPPPPAPPAPPPPRPPLTTSPHASVHPAVVVAGVAAAAGLLLGGSLALYAYVRDPGDTPTTNSGASYNDLQNDADAAHAAAIGADVSLIVSAIAATTAIVVAIALPGAETTKTSLLLAPDSAYLSISF